MPEKTLFEHLEAGLKDILAGRYRVLKPKTTNVRDLRRILGLTQGEFALAFKIPVTTLRSWEQKQREPDQAAEAYLRIIAAHPKMVERTLWGGKAPRVEKGVLIIPKTARRFPSPKTIKTTKPKKAGSGVPVRRRAAAATSKHPTKKSK